VRKVAAIALNLGPFINMANVVPKHQIEKALLEERQDISSGRLKEENPLDTSAEFRTFCEACRRGDLKTSQEQITKGVNINARDAYDYTPLILVSIVQAKMGVGGS